MRRPLLLAVVGAFWGSCLTGCIPALVRNRSDEPNAKPPVSYPAPVPPSAAGADLASHNWRDVFTSPSLRKLIDEALGKNQELNQRIQELVILQNEAAARHGEYKPKLRGAVNMGLDRVGKDTSQGVSDEAHELANPLGDFGFGLVASWEVDVWGKLRAEAAAADARYMAGVEGRNFVVTQLVAEIARSYYDLLALDASLAVLDRNIAIQNRALALIKVEKQAARVTELAVQRFEAEVLKNRSLKPALEQERVLVQNRINFLVGRYPQAVPRQVRELDTPLPPLLRAGLPSALLENRPDVRQAEQELSAAKLDVQAARAAFYPALAIDAKAGFKSFNPAHLMAIPESLAGGLGGNLVAPLLNRAAIEAEYRSADARQIAAVIGYERAVLQAFTDVTNQLANLKNTQQSYGVRAQQVEKLKNSVEMSTVLFRAARADYVEVLLVRRDLLEAEMEVIERRKLVQQAVVNLYQALGGGWRSTSTS